MPRFRSKPTEVEAEQFTADHVLRLKPLPPGLHREETGDAGSLEGAEVRFYVVTVQGEKVYVRPGEWVIVEMNRGTGCTPFAYPCADAIFRAKYDPV